MDIDNMIGKTYNWNRILENKYLIVGKKYQNKKAKRWKKEMNQWEN